MLRVVSQGIESFNNRAIYAQNPWYRSIKLFYYQTFAAMYRYAGQCVDRAMVNSTWTKGHIDTIWAIPARTSIVYPPCDVHAMASFAFQPRSDAIVSVGQFRPEKNHPFQLHVFKRFLDSGYSAQLILIGGVRNQEDQDRVDELKQLAIHLKIQVGIFNLFIRLIFLGRIAFRFKSI
jgi:alpha-1,2-mannosyltransferase